MNFKVTNASWKFFSMPYSNKPKDLLTQYSGNLPVLRMRKTLGNSEFKFCFYHLIFDFGEPKLLDLIYSPKKLGMIISVYITGFLGGNRKYENS